MTRIFIYLLIFFRDTLNTVFLCTKIVRSFLRFDSLKSPLPLSFRRLQGDRVLYMV